MAKKQSGSVPNRAIYSRLSYLYQAAAYLGSQAPPSADSGHPRALGSWDESQAGPGAQDQTREPHKDIHATASRRLLSDLRAVSLKTQIRIDPSIKRTICKYCDTLLVEGTSCTSSVENRSRGGKKPWADVLVMKCGTCGREKRFPISAARQKRRPFREGEVKGDVDGVVTLPER
ncbi:uncharacterized protein DNG_02860 [Cephalotrichum gorgonifer]|uniref:Rpr2-domain-containing protein n=1 Tax=Cephalotrichum gorgonifer TaxID=2041049 RepID=A0AAE8MV33_9PEZI|nr:uncharacterized protein DNG_02860 [Cephalotrichum gorgonifer]